jgi:hypothetical protein
METTLPSQDRVVPSPIGKLEVGVSSRTQISVQQHARDRDHGAKLMRTTYCGGERAPMVPSRFTFPRRSRSAR